MDTRIVEVGYVEDPQFLMTRFSEGDAFKFLLVYTGAVGVGHGATDYEHLRVECPLLAWATDSSGTDKIAILSFEDTDLFESAVASAAHSYFQTKDRACDVAITRVRADLKQVSIGTIDQGVPVTKVINAVVLSMVAASAYSNVAYINYNVTVLGKFVGRSFPIPILLDGMGWTGKYDIVVNPPLKRGNPSQ